MRVLMLTCNNGLQDGINRHILSVAPVINALPGCEVAVCTTFSSGELNAALDRLGVKTFALNLPHGHDLRTWSRFSAVIRAFRPDLIHAHVMGVLQRFYLGVFCRRIPIVSTCHGISDFENGLRKMTLKDRIGFLLDWTMPGKAVKTIYVSRGVSRAKGCAMGMVVYNPVIFEEDHIVGKPTALHDELKLSADVPVIGTACRISAIKQPRLFVDVMCRVLAQVPTAYAVVCGTTNDEALMVSLKEQVSASGVAERFHWLGYRTDVPNIMRELACFVLTSATEGMPTALLEAMSVKTPIAFMRGRGGLEDLDEFNRLEGPIGVVVEMNDCYGMARGIVELLQNPDLARSYSEAAFACGKRHLDVRKIATQLVNIYKSVIK